MKKIYFAAPFFSQGERRGNAIAVKMLEDNYDVFYPYRDGLRVTDLVAKDVEPSAASKEIFKLDVEEIENADLIVAVLDGRVPDEGVCVELGIAFSLKKTVVGVLSDSRTCFPWGLNPMVSGCLSVVCTDFANLLEVVDEQIIE